MMDKVYFDSNFLGKYEMIAICFDNRFFFQLANHLLNDIT